MDWTVSEPMLLPLMNCEADFVMWAQSVSQKTLRTEAFRKTRNNSIGPRPRRARISTPHGNQNPEMLMHRRVCTREVPVFAGAGRPTCRPCSCARRRARRRAAQRTNT